MKREKWAGSMTVEAAICLPVFIIVVFTLIMLTKLVYVHSLVQQGLTQTVKEISTYSYILEALEIIEMHDDIIGTFGENIDVTQLDEKLEDIKGVLDGNADALGNVIDQVAEAPMDYGKDMLYGGLSSVALNGYLSLLDGATGFIGGLIFPQYIQMSKEELNDLLLLLGVKGGLDGIHIQAKIPNSGGTKTLDLVAVYQIDLDPPLAYFMNEKTIVQRASCVPWGT